jgi:anti-anti-sigma factor
MKLKITQETNATVIESTVDKLDSKLAPELKSQFIILANDENSGHLIVDLGNITFADSSGLSALLMAHRLYREKERKLIICNLSVRVQKLIEISQLTTLFEIATSRDEALSKLG